MSTKIMNINNILVSNKSTTTHSKKFQIYKRLRKDCTKRRIFPRIKKVYVSIETPPKENLTLNVSLNCSKIRINNALESNRQSFLKQNSLTARKRIDLKKNQNQEKYEQLFDTIRAGNEKGIDQQDLYLYFRGQKYMGNDFESVNDHEITHEFFSVMDQSSKGFINKKEFLTACEAHESYSTEASLFENPNSLRKAINAFSHNKIRKL